MQITDPTHEDDPHAWPSVYEPDPMQATVDAKAPAPGASKKAKASDEAGPEVESCAMADEPQIGNASTAREIGATLCAPKRAYGSSATTIAATPATLSPRSADLDMFPAFMSRSALFGAFRPNCGGTHAGPLKAAGDVSLNFEGPRLSMADKRVWEAIIRIAKREGVDMSQPFKARVAEVAKMAGYGAGQSRSAWAAMERLVGSKIDAVVKGAKVSGWLLISAVPSGRDAVVRLDVGLVDPAFSQSMLASMAGAVSDGIQAPLAQWLRDYFSTHKPPAKPLTLDYLRGLSGCPSQPKHFVAALKASMEQLRACRPDLVASWSIDKCEGGGNASARWTLLAVRGPAMPNVKHPAKRPAPSAPAIAPQTKRRGGPNL